MRRCEAKLKEKAGQRGEFTFPVAGNTLKELGTGTTQAQVRDACDVEEKCTGFCQNKDGPSYMYSSHLDVVGGGGSNALEQRPVSGMPNGGGEKWGCFVKGVKKQQQAEGKESRFVAQPPAATEGAPMSAARFLRTNERKEEASSFTLTSSSATASSASSSVLSSPSAADASTPITTVSSSSASSSSSSSSSTFSSLLSSPSSSTTTNMAAIPLLPSLLRPAPSSATAATAALQKRPIDTPNVDVVSHDAMDDAIEKQAQQELGSAASSSSSAVAAATMNHRGKERRSVALGFMAGG